MRNLTCLAMALAIVIGFSGQTAKAAPADYVAYWQFDGDNTDSSSNGYDLTTGTGFAAGAGVVGDAAQFSHDALVTADTRSADVNSVPLIRDIGSQFTLSMWIKPEDINTGQKANAYADLFAVWHTSFTPNERDGSIVVRWTNWSGRIQVGLSEDGAATVTNHTDTGGPDEQFADADDTWYHVAVVGDLDGDDASVDDLYMYVTAITAGSANAPVVKGLSISSIYSYSGVDGVVNMAIGSGTDNFSSNQFLRTSAASEDGRMDEIAFYNRALSGAEIGELFAAGKAGQAIPEPATMGLLAMGALMILPRRRR